ncbi:MAG: leucine-rich repeat domain-containing protein [Muribaculaceae bacterium]|nr:leucine-rich repeat domain-containing protein [Muribaculaceae bacterium]
MKQSLLLLFSFSALLPAYAADFVWQGVNYTVLDEAKKTCTTKAGTFEMSGNDVSGELVIPAAASDGAVEYKVVAVGEYSFANNVGLTKVVLPNSIDEVGMCAFGRSALTAVDLGSSVRSIGVQAFGFCNSLSEVSVPASVEEMGDNPFVDCAQLKSVIVDAENEYFCSADGVLYDKSKTRLLCYPIGKESKDFEIPSFVETISAWAFDHSALVSITVPAGVKKIEKCAFQACYDLEALTYWCVAPVAAERNVFSNPTYNSCTLYVAHDAADAIAATMPWSQFANVQYKERPAGIVDVEADAACPVLFYNIEGMRIDADRATLPAGIYIRRQGSEVSKLLVR